MTTLTTRPRGYRHRRTWLTAQWPTVAADRPRPDPHPVDPRRPRGAADPAAQSYLSELRAVTADAWRGTSTHPTTAALRATRAGRLAIGAVHLGRRFIRADLAFMSRAARDELVAEARRRDLIRSWR